MDYEALGGCFLIWAVPTLLYLIYVGARDAAKNYPAYKAQQERKKRMQQATAAIRQQPPPVVPTPQELARQVKEAYERDLALIEASPLPEHDKRAARRHAQRKVQKRLRRLLGE